MDSSTPLPETQAPAKEPSSDFKSEGNPKSLGKLERVHIDELEMLSCELDALTLDPPKPSYEIRYSPFSIALVAYRFKKKTKEPMGVLKESCTTDDLADLLEGSCPFCCDPEGKPLEQPKTEISSDKETFEG